MRGAKALILTALLALAACKDAAEQPKAEKMAAPSAKAAPVARPAAPSAARHVKEATELYELDYAYPASAGAIPALKAKFDAQIDTLRAELLAEVKEEKEMSDPDFVFRAHSRSYDWRVVTENADWLSLSTLASTYTGGAHPGYWFEAVLWDKRAGRERKALDLFTSKEALSEAIRPAFCRSIDRQREKKRGEPVVRSPDEMFSECLDPADYVVILGSSNRRTFDRIGILVPPYEAGPYAEGDYEVTLPVNAAILATVRSEFRASFAAQ